MTWLERLQRLIPHRDTLQSSSGLRWLTPWLGHPKIWHWSRRGVAMGVAVGVFFGLLIPIAQIPMSAAAAIALRANLPVAAASTFISNPVTFPPIYYAAYKLGAWVTGASEAPVEERASEDVPVEDQSFWSQIGSMGKPLLVGLSTMACLAGLLTYVAIGLFWRWRTAQRWRNRGKARSWKKG
jgi:uncharacterized protein (DUF2062 family)